LAAVGIAAHEVGHAIQHARNYFPAWLRTALVPVTRVCFILGLTAACFGLVYSSSLASIAVGLFAGCLLFHLVNLPVEFDASARARELALEAGIIHVEERAGMDRVLRAAALTYVGKTFAAGLVFLGLSLMLLLRPETPMSLTWEDNPLIALIMVVDVVALAWSAQRRRLQKTAAPGVRELDNTGNLHASQGEYVQAIAAFTKALRLDPRRADVYANRGVCYYHTKQYDEALADLDTSIRLAPGRAEAYIWRGHVRYGRGEYDQAMADYDAALKLEPDSVAVLKDRGRAWLESGEQARARLDFDRVLALEPGDASSYFNRGITWFQLEDWDRALADFNQAIAHDGKQPQSYAMRGTVWLVKGEYDRAIEDYNEALRRGGDRAPILRDRGLARFRKGDFNQAARDLNESIALNAEDAVTYNNRGATFQKKGEYARALSDLQQALRLNPNLPNAYKNLAWLQATCPEPQFRDGTAAVANASRALELSKGKEPAWLEILAAAHAEAGNLKRRCA
jgi:tetratricopeptide (TPR) repeat protein